MESGINASKENNKEKKSAKPNTITEKIKSDYFLQKLYDNKNNNIINNNPINIKRNLNKKSNNINNININLDELNETPKSNHTIK